MSSYLKRLGAIFDENSPVIPQNVEARCVACLFKLPDGVSRIPGDTPFENYFKPNSSSTQHVVATDNFQKSIQRGCPTCKVISPSRTFSSLRCKPDDHFTWRRDELSWSGHYESDSTNTWCREVFLACEDDSRVEHPHPFASTRRSVGVNTGSARTVARVRGWIDDCVTNHSHPGCGEILETPLPKGVRMLEIEDHHLARVHLIDNLPRAKFAALSHRWGPETEKASLKIANHDEFRKQVPQSSLYQLLRDAIKVAGEVDLKYIWIDCLCIVQDDGNDWNYQSGHMATIFAGAFITISGTGCINAEKGLFRDSPIAANTVMMTGTAPCPVYFGPTLDHPYIFPIGPGPHRLDLSPETYPLAGRGWVYQERALSKRVIHFTPQEVIWECMEKPQCECGYYKNANLGPKNDILDLPWIEIVRNYSHMHLTESTDRLPAIAGIAKSYAERHSRTYLAGLWKETIAGDLLWFWQPSRRSPLEDLGPRGRPIAPTWSWASSRPLSHSSDWSSSLPTHITFEKYDFEPAPGGDDYSQPVAARLHVEGPVVFGTLIGCWYPGDSEVLMEFEGEPGRLRPDYDISAAGDGHIEFGTSLPFLLLINVEGSAFGIVLRPEEENGNTYYERIDVIGYGRNDPIYHRMRPLQYSWVLERAKRMKLILV